jgi:hypothetical protein
VARRGAVPPLPLFPGTPAYVGTRRKGVMWMESLLITLVLLWFIQGDR